MREFRHVDLATGLGGFTLAAHWAGFRTVAMCEIDRRRRAFLQKTWGIEVDPDLRTFDGTRYRGVELLTGGFPCQPVSRAGKRRGKADDRWLWDEGLRVLAEAEPDSVLFENPVGIIDMGIDGILSEMERIGYEVQPFDIPACAVDSPQLRHRIWIVGFRAVAYSGNGDDHGGRGPIGETASISGEHRARRQPRQSCRTDAPLRDMANDGERRRRKQESGRGSEGGTASGRDSQSDMANGTGTRHQRADSERGTAGRTPQRCANGELVHAEREREQRRGMQTEQPETAHGGIDRPNVSQWSGFVWVPCADDKFRRAADESFPVVNGLHRSLLEALGNTIVPEVAYQIIRAIKQTLTDYVAVC